LCVESLSSRASIIPYAFDQNPNSDCKFKGGIGKVYEKWNLAKNRKECSYTSRNTNDDDLYIII
jgi:hypothetical protein